jgi:hypothetical protein
MLQGKRPSEAKEHHNDNLEETCKRAKLILYLLHSSHHKANFIIPTLLHGSDSNRESAGPSLTCSNAEMTVPTRERAKGSDLTTASIATPSPPAGSLASGYVRTVTSMSSWGTSKSRLFWHDIDVFRLCGSLIVWVFMFREQSPEVLSILGSFFVIHMVTLTTVTYR